MGFPAFGRFVRADPFYKGRKNDREKITKENIRDVYQFIRFKAKRDENIRDVYQFMRLAEKGDGKDVNELVLRIAYCG